jgi:hypothetical protein
MKRYRLFNIKYVGIAMAVCGLFVTNNAFAQWTRASNQVYPTSTAYNVGIGTTAAQSYKLYVNGTSYFTAGNLESSGGNVYLHGGNVGIGVSPVGGNVLTTGGIAQFQGNVGIGSTAPGAYRLNVSGGPSTFAGNVTISGTNTFTTGTGLGTFGGNLTVGGNLSVNGATGITTGALNSCVNFNNPGISSYIFYDRFSTNIMELTRYGDMIVKNSVNVPTVYATNITATGTITVGLNGWTISAPDYVFDKDYKLRPLNEVEKFIADKKHLPEVASAKEMKEKGVDLVKMNMSLLKKVEELTLYVIAQNKKIEKLEKKITEKN